MSVSKSWYAVPSVVVAMLVGLAITATSGSSEPPPARKQGIFTSMKVGQSVSLREKGPMWEVHTTDDGTPLTHKVAEIGEDYIVVRDETGMIETRIPVTAIRAVVHVKTKGK